MENFKHEKVVANRVEAVNELHKYIRQIVPLYQEYLSKGFKITRTGEFFKKDLEVLQSIAIACNHPTRIRHYIKITKYSIYICFDTHYQVEENVAQYYEYAVYIWDYREVWQKIPFVLETFRTDFTVEEILQTEETVKTLDKQRGELAETVSTIKALYRGFFRK